MAKKKVKAFIIFLLFMISAVIFSAVKSFVFDKVAGYDAGKLWGAYVGDDIKSLQNFENKVGVKLNMAVAFVNYSSPFPFVFAENLKANSQTLVLFWEQNDIPLDDIISGRYDSYIRQFAHDVKIFGSPVIINPLHEMNGNWSSWGGMVGSNSPEKVINAFRRMGDIFGEVNVPNAKWGWVVNNESVPDIAENDIVNYYPGDEYVDYVGVDGFNFGEPWQSYSDIFSSALEKIKKYNKPIYIFSMGCAQGPQKSEWISDAILSIKADKNIFGWVWFNYDKEKNWTIWSDKNSLQAFKDAIKK